MSDSLRPHGLQHTRLPVLHQLPELAETHVHIVGDAIQPACPLLSPSPPAIKLSQHQSLFQGVGSFHQVTKVFVASASVLLMNMQGWFSLRLSGLISLQSKWILKSLLQLHSLKASILQHTTFFIVQHSHPYMTAGKAIALTRHTFVGKVMSLLFNMLSVLVIAFLLRKKHLLNSWLRLPSAVILEPKKIKSVTVSTFSPSICHDVMGLNAMILVFLNIFLRQLFHSSLSPSSRGSLVSVCFLPLVWYHLHIWGYWYFSLQFW